MADDVQKQILEELREIKELLSLMSNDGTPLRAMLPSSEFVAAAVMASALLGRETVNIHPIDIEQRIKAAQQLALLLTKEFDSFSQSTQVGRLELQLHDQEAQR